MLFLYSFSAILSSPNKSTSGQLFFYKVDLANSTLRKKCLYSELFWIQSECRKIQTRTTPNTDNLVIQSLFLQNPYNLGQIKDMCK